MTEREKMLNGEWYDTSDPWLVSQRNIARDVSEQYNRTSESEIEEGCPVHSVCGRHCASRKEQTCSGKTNTVSH